MYNDIKLGEKPEIRYYKHNNIDMVCIPYDLFEVSPGIYSWKELNIRYVSLNYKNIVSTLIDMKYSQADMTAIINNYLLDPENEETKKDFNEMQEHRKYAKRMAKDIASALNLK